MTDRMAHSKWRNKNIIEYLQYGLGHGLHKQSGWIWKSLKVDVIIPGTMGALRERCYDAYQAQKNFIMVQKQVMPDGWDPIDPMNSVKKQKGTGKFMIIQKAKTPVPANDLTASFLRFRRWMGEGREFVMRVSHNKEKNVIET
jgi:hypothetical protein